MTRRLLALALLLAPSPAMAAVRAVFVGVDKYLYSQTHVAENQFEDLSGAVNDVSRIKDAMRSAYGFDLDRPASGCRSSNTVSITLTDACATHDAVIAAIEAQITASAKGDTLIFYFAGHGAQTDDGTFHDQGSGRNDTILPADAREPDAPAPRDIIDHDMRVIINGAVAKGVNFVSIYDSCHSGTATRGFAGLGKKRSAPDLKIAPSPDVHAVPGPGYWVHFGASTDDEESYEHDVGAGRQGGVFTDALVRTLAQPALAAATYGDIAAAVQLAVRDGGHVDQHPQVEGDVNATLLGGAARAIPLFAAKPAGRVATLAVGGLSGVTTGSSYALFGSRATALDDHARPLATGHVIRADAYSATLALDRSVAGAPLVARETDHAYGDRQLRVGFAFPLPDLKAAVARALKTTPFATLASPPQVVVTREGSEMSPVGLYMADGTGLRQLPPVTDPRFQQVLEDELKRVARVQALLALRTDPKRGDMMFCIDELADTAPCAPATGDHGLRLAIDQPIRVTLVNNTDRARHFYVFGIDESNNVGQILPIVGTDEPLAARRALTQDQSITPRSAGPYMFVALASDVAIDAAALQQGARGAEVCGGTALARLLCDANSGTRDATAPAVGAWSALVIPATVVVPRNTP